ncbi:hypothetical protein HORIV_49480 [Vreelandella olivaria]|uniref:Type II toxin-antitoxin system RelE/ParE family toxin n=1 Tax=Vreelandella olivaria TaxID=390919 RepID=A0ABN5X085_9GAMM|nr:hypothetical protein HORIV_49480 [Halomonas olivaria]
MSHRVYIRPEAEQDLEDAAAWYTQQRPGLGQAFLDEVVKSFEQIAEEPRLYPIVHRDTRRALISRFPFGVFYRIEVDFIVIVAVMHGSRDPQRWKQRT